ncbi:MAG: hypothetical protein NQ127_00260 [Candidatus Cardinium sp.]|nr:hypothetical protein [Candidatus Cardinium sp.]
MALFPLLFAGECGGGKSPEQPLSKDNVARKLEDIKRKLACVSESKTEASIKSLSQVKAGAVRIAEKEKATKSFIEKWYKDTIELVISDCISFFEELKKIIESNPQSEEISAEELCMIELYMRAPLQRFEQSQKFLDNDNDTPEWLKDALIDIITSTSKELQQRLNDLKRDLRENKRIKSSYVGSILIGFVQSIFNKLKLQLPTIVIQSLLEVEKKEGLEVLKEEMKSIEKELKAMIEKDLKAMTEKDLKALQNISY